ncbi:MAG: hypothetical protein A3J46_02700 [Candidatus Yanofskybacteria bacterium RIFCSPHIGHO2_02_FULL_41_11]|uniref:Uncharacterized protein n=1 Tax=Candidatus Yanofskybacteria bacterium RIFCSPHIGHO2_02_FULL_41_11 TaxID=1802675 RepID=A0A1F8F981_9BACT|nr:MAG: hypothetical protein A3J46_02700 [Candidatus Yanofskybacteria bacterium RIFCSPHIGHO2_02_FULL_41_11]
MVQYLEKYKQNIAVDMRRRGFSYSEIESRLHIPKSTLSYWLKNLKLTPEQIKKLNDKRVEVAKANVLKKISKNLQMIEEIKNSSAQDIKKISKKELWLMGIILYWKNGNKSDLRKGVHFSSSDPHMIKLFLKWLREVGGVQDEEIKFEIFRKGNRTNKNNSPDKIIDYWMKAVGFSKGHSSHIYFQKAGKKKSKPGFIRIKVAQSSMLARQITGWIEGLKNINNIL